jgi:hypothetical protein
VHTQMREDRDKVVSVSNYLLCLEEALGSGGTTSCILDLGTRWRRVVNFTILPLYP